MSHALMRQAVYNCQRSTSGVLPPELVKLAQRESRGEVKPSAPGPPLRYLTVVESRAGYLRSIVAHHRRQIEIAETELAELAERMS